MSSPSARLASSRLGSPSASPVSSRPSWRTPVCSSSGSTAASPASRTDRSPTTFHRPARPARLRPRGGHASSVSGAVLSPPPQAPLQPDRPNGQPQSEASPSQPDDRAADAARHRPRRPRRVMARHGVGQGAVFPGAPGAIPYDAPRSATSEVRIGLEPDPSPVRRQAADRSAGTRDQVGGQDSSLARLQGGRAPTALVIRYSRF